MVISSYLQRDVSGVTVKNVEILLQPENRLKIQKSVLQHSLKSCFKHQCVQDFIVCVSQPSAEGGDGPTEGLCEEHRKLQWGMGPMARFRLGD